MCLVKQQLLQVHPGKDYPKTLLNKTGRCQNTGQLLELLKLNALDVLFFRFVVLVQTFEHHLPAL